MKLRKDLIDIDSHVAKMIRKYRILSGLSQRDLARKAGISSQQIQKYESLKSKINASKLYEIALILEVPLYYFFENEQTIAKFGWLYLPKKIVKKFSKQRRQEFVQLILNFGKIDSYLVRRSILNIAENLANNKKEKNNEF